MKNISKDALGSQLGRIHMTKQDYSQLQTRKMKALKAGRKERARSEASELEDNEDFDDDGDEDGGDAEMEVDE